MNKNILIAVFTIIGLVIIFYALKPKENKKEEPVTITESSLIRELNIDDLIKEAQLIIIGEVTSKMPSQWKATNGQEAKNAAPEAVFEAGGLFTDTLFSINQTLKGNYNESIIRVRSFVGETEQVRWVNSMEPDYKVGQIYLLFLYQDSGPTQIVDPGDYIAVNAIDGVYEIKNGKAISLDDEWTLDDLVARIKALAP